MLRNRSSIIPPSLSLLEADQTRILIRRFLRQVEFCDREKTLISTDSKLDMRLRILDPKKRKDKHKENEAIQFDFDMNIDTADEVAKAMSTLTGPRCLHLIMNAHSRQAANYSWYRFRLKPRVCVQPLHPRDCR